MPSRDPDELEAELRSSSFGGDSDVLEDLREEARETVTAQRETLDDIDTKASKILRINVLTVGVIVSGFSIAASSSGGEHSVVDGIGQLLNTYTGTGVCLVLLSTGLAGLTYTLSEIDAGISTDNLQKLLDSDISTTNADELLLKNYAVRMNFNNSTIVRNAPLVTTTILCLVAGILFVAIGVYRGISGEIPHLVSLSATSVVVLLVFVSGEHRQLYEALEDLRRWR